MKWKPSSYPKKKGKSLRVERIVDIWRDWDGGNADGDYKNVGGEGGVWVWDFERESFFFYYYISL